MRTTKPVATISYNSPEFLKVKLEELRRGKIISFWAFISHQPEEDERKKHIHVYCEPSKMLQTDDLKNFCIEFNPGDPDKPFGTIGWRSSKFADWYLYGLHDAAYLSSKGQSRHFHYSHDDFISSDNDEFDELVRQIDRFSVTPYASMIDSINHGLSWEEFFARGTVPIPQINAWRLAYQSLIENQLKRNGRKNHEVNESTGELIDKP